MNSIRTIYVFRHGQTDWNTQGRIQGHIDIPLNDNGREQARRLIPVLQRMGVEAYLSSDLSRAAETARIIAEAAGPLPVELDPRLREIHLGKIEGLDRREIEQLLGLEFSARLRSSPLSDSDVEILGSESGEQVYQRALESLVTFCQRVPYRKIGVATHGGVLRRLIQYAREDQGFPAPIPNGIVYPLLLDVREQRLRFEGFTEF